ncbi:hypothetical protein T492DRAFT_844171 [Pavlovales sp. CCMP2436]|nr:hypothetical protein T492DRAFT_844171 [Pavlovales sp. CCMP2436]
MPLPGGSLQCASAPALTIGGGGGPTPAHHAVSTHRGWRRNDPGSQADAIRRAADARPQQQHGNYLPGGRAPIPPIRTPPTDPLSLSGALSPAHFRSGINALEVEAAQESYTVDPYGTGPPRLNTRGVRKCWATLEQLARVGGHGQGLLQKLLATLDPAVFTEDTDENGERIPHTAVLAEYEAKLRKEQGRHEVRVRSLGGSVSGTLQNLKHSKSESEAWAGVSRVHDELAIVLAAKEERILMLERRAQALMDEVDEALMDEVS